MNAHPNYLNDTFGATAAPSPNTLDQNHWAEILASGVSREITEANFRSFSGQTALEIMTEEAIAKVQRVESYPTEPAKRILKRNENVLDGGWFVNGLDPINNWERMQWGQFKPNTPRLDPKKGKAIKYQSPEGLEARAIFLAIPFYPAYWAKVQSDTSIPVYLCEGAKKAGLLLSLGYAAIALPGVWMAGRWRDKQGKLPQPHLIPELTAFAQPGRKFIFVFDEDEKPKTQEQVCAAKRQTAKLLESSGCEVLTTTWSHQLGKGIDDLWANHGADRVHQVIAAAAPLPEPRWEGQGFRAENGGKAGADKSNEWTRDKAIAKRKLSFYQVLSLLQKDYRIMRKDDSERDVAFYEGHTPEFSQALIDGIPTIMVRGFLASGKTHAAIESIKRMVTELGTYKQFVWISTRNGLLRQSEARLLSKELGIPIYFFQQDVTRHRQLMESRKPGIFIMTDACFSNYHVGRVDWSNITVFIDEWAGVRSQIPSKTKYFSEFKRMLSTARQLVVIDAFLGDVDCRILSCFRAGERLILDQVPSKAAKRIRLIECTTAAEEIALSHDGAALGVLDSWFKGRSLEEGERYIVVTDSLLSAKVVQLYAMSKFKLTESEVMILCSETVELTHQVMPDPDAAIKSSGAKLVILTPTAESGIDIQIPFKAGLGLFCGVIPGTSAMQLLGRARLCNDWIVSAPMRSLDSDYSLSSEAKIKKIIARLQHETLEESGMQSDNRSHGWEVWQREIRQVQSFFNHEYISHLLKEHYETVEVTKEFNLDNRGWIALVSATKDRDAVKALTSDLENGLTMIQEEKTPSKDQHVWDIRLAKSNTQHPDLWEPAIELYSSGDRGKQKMAIDWAKGLLKDRELGALKRYVVALDGNLDDDNALNDRLSRSGSNYNSPAFKQLQNQTLFRILNLESLARFESGAEVKAINADEESLDARSPKVQALWAKFKATPRLVRLFPAVETIKDFWRQVKATMRYFLFEAVSGTARAKRDGEKPSLYFVGWMSRAQSGSAFLVQNFDKIVKSIRKRLELERVERKDRESHSPPD